WLGSRSRARIGDGVPADSRRRRRLLRAPPVCHTGARCGGRDTSPGQRLDARDEPGVAGRTEDGTTMKMRKLDTLGMALVAWGMSAAVIVACTPEPSPMDDDDGGSTTMPMTMTTTGASTGNEDVDESEGGKLDTPSPTGDTPLCQTDGSCDLIDLLFVIDNSGTMGEEQLNLARNFQQLVDELENLTDGDGTPVNPNVNIMVTTSDFGHPLCTAFQKPDYQPRQGAPVYTGCNSRI